MKSETKQKIIEMETFLIKNARQTKFSKIVITKEKILKMMKVANVKIKSKSIMHFYSSNRRMRQDGTKRRLVCNNSKQLSVMN